MGVGRHNNAKRKSMPEDLVDVISDKVLGLVFLCLTSPLDLLRAAFTCRHWRQVIARDGFLILISLHDAPTSHFVGHYHIDERLYGCVRLPGRNLVFVASSSSSWTGILALDFLPVTTYGEFNWELTDIQGGFLLLLDFNGSEDNWDWVELKCLIVSDPLARRYKMIPPSMWFSRSFFFGAAPLDGENARACISLTNFMPMSALYSDGITKAYTSSSAALGHWITGATARGGRVICGNDYWTAVGEVIFAGSTAGSTNWMVGNFVLALNKETGELSSSVLPEALRGKCLALEYAYELRSPPTIRAALS